MIYAESDELALQAVRAWVKLVTGYADELVRVSEDRGAPRPIRPYLSVKITESGSPEPLDESIPVLTVGETAPVTLRGSRQLTAELHAFGSACSLLNKIKASRSRHDVTELNFEAGLSVIEVGPIRYLPTVPQSIFESRAVMSFTLAYMREETDAESIIQGTTAQFDLTLKGDPSDIQTTITDELP